MHKSKTIPLGCSDTTTEINISRSWSFDASIKKTKFVPSSNSHEHCTAPGIIIHAVQLRRYYWSIGCVT
ncbi:hypothetical protein CJ030_MR4G000604 [Morella rubra]|uniref:Uncharacterized protein n=1 Tax=Morella rubra TaxID=262757 RepID=A0A6A1VTX9_9ROSI|nr:hypothetical protein CJ030_MR4G000604 [Morella rubra]